MSGGFLAGSVPGGEVVLITGRNIHHSNYKKIFKKQVSYLLKCCHFDLLSKLSLFSISSVSQTLSLPFLPWADPEIKFGG